MFVITKNPTTPRRLNKFGGVVLGSDFGATEQYLTKDGKPYICRMGEIHFSRVPEECWEEELIKMRDGGIDIISSYVFWLHHEETEGKFRFDGNRNIAKFLEICKKIGMPFIMRIGPWVHGEARNGGFPDWLSAKTNGVMRTDAEPYLTYVRRFFEQIYAQVKDCLDVVVGIQLENELRKQKNYVIKLKEMLTDIGFSAPYLTFTGWGGSDSSESCPDGEVLFLYGGYPEAPWLEHIEEYFGSENYLFSKERDDGNIGKDLFERDGGAPLKQNESAANTPFLTCELGGGNQVTYHRRPIITANDIFSLAICKLGSGANGLGYYVYHGGINPVGKTTAQESRDTGYPNDLPVISYDFQAPIGEAGQIRRSYFLLRTLHKFIDSDGHKLAVMPAELPDVLPTDRLDTTTLRCAVRSDGTSGYLFVSNHYHGGRMNKIFDIVKIALTDGDEIEIPVKLEPHTAGIIPFNYRIGTDTVRMITALPQGEDADSVYFAKIPGLEPEICLDGKNVQPLTNGMTVGGKKLIIADEDIPSPQHGKKIILSAPIRSCDRSFFGHIINYDGSVPEFTDVNEYNFRLPENTKYLRIEALGNIGALYHGNTLISDFYLYGDKWTVDVRRLPSGCELTVKILPLTEKDKSKIFFEYDMPIGAYEPNVYAVSDEIMFV